MDFVCAGFVFVFLLSGLCIILAIGGGFASAMTPEIQPLPGETWVSPRVGTVIVESIQCYGEPSSYDKIICQVTSPVLGFKGRGRLTLTRSMWRQAKFQPVEEDK